ncbi:MAG TPA: hypothetical protein VE596_01345 [Gaiellaceae bacterium]|jgi:hypothetical protein|nr:hypothetical protein [Gaiellaceae bacterium]
MPTSSGPAAAGAAATSASSRASRSAPRRSARWRRTSLDLNLTATETRTHVTSAGQYLGSAADLQAALAPPLAVGTPTHVEVKSRTFLEAVLHFAHRYDPTGFFRFRQSIR